MRKIEEQELLDYISGHQENRNLEFKPSFHWNALISRKLKEEVIKSIIALTNIPGGGSIVLGIVHKQRGRDSRYVLEGVERKELSWVEANYETVERHVHDYCSEPPVFEIVWGETGKISLGKLAAFILIFVQEFSSLPTICTKTGKEKEDNGKDSVLREGDIYTRSYKAQWGSKRCSAKELEEIIKMAADKHRQELKVRGYVKLNGLIVKLREERSDYE